MLAAALWRLAGTLAPPVLALLLRQRLRRGKEIADRLGERRGIDATPRPPGPLLWLHAASVGETVSILPVLRELRTRVPSLNLLVTTGSVTSAAVLAQRLAALGIGDVLHRFVPLDVPAWVGRFLDHWRPDAGALVESELWPNLLAACASRKVPMLLLNARLSAASFAGWRRAPGLARRTLGAFRAVQARSEEDARRLRTLGAPAVSVPGDLKFAADQLPVDATEFARLRLVLGDRPVWLAASTHEGEERVARDVHDALLDRHPGLLTILAPRHPERGDAIAALGPCTRRSRGEDPPECAGVWLVDTLGELGLCYRVAETVFIGNSLTGAGLKGGGGQNPLEAARLGCAIAIGPHTRNFSEAVTALTEAAGLAVVTDAAGLTAWVDAMLSDPTARLRMAEAAAGAADRWHDLPAHCAASLLTLLP